MIRARIVVRTRTQCLPFKMIDVSTRFQISPETKSRSGSAIMSRIRIPEEVSSWKTKKSLSHRRKCRVYRVSKKRASTRYIHIRWFACCVIPLPLSEYSAMLALNKRFCTNALYRGMLDLTVLTEGWFQLRLLSLGRFFTTCDFNWITFSKMYHLARWYMSAPKCSSNDNWNNDTRNAKIAKRIGLPKIYYWMSNISFISSPILVILLLNRRESLSESSLKIVI